MQANRNILQVIDKWIFFSYKLFTYVKAAT